MTQKVIYFTADDVPNPSELLELQAIIQPHLIEAPITVSTRNAKHAASMTEECDFVAGDVPDIEPYNEIAEFDPETFTPPVGTNQAVVTDGLELTIGASTYTFTVEDGEITAIAVES